LLSSAGHRASTRRPFCWTQFWTQTLQYWPKQGNTRRARRSQKCQQNGPKSHFTTLGETSFVEWQVRRVPCPRLRCLPKSRTTSPALKARCGRAGLRAKVSGRRQAERQSSAHHGWRQRDRTRRRGRHGARGREDCDHLSRGTQGRQQDKRTGET